MLITINNCNNIDAAEIILELNKLNIKIAPNGTGKSTIAKAMRFISEKDTNALNNLMPFKFKSSNPENKKPEIRGTEDLRKVMCFDEAYVNKFVFQNEEVLANSFDILIRTEDYKKIEQELEQAVAAIRQVFTNNQELENLIANFKEMSNAFTLTPKAKLSQSSPALKGLGKGNTIQNVPKELEGYNDFIKSKQNIKWISWQIDGYNFSDFSNNCPFCTENTSEKKDLIKKVGEKYDKNTIKNLNNIINIVDKLGEYFSDETRINLNHIMSLRTGLEAIHESNLLNIKNQIDIFIDKLNSLQTLSSFQFKNGEEVAAQLKSYEINLFDFSELNSTKTKETIEPLNKSLKSVIEQASTLKGIINKQRAGIRKVVEKHQADINNFLTFAGYNYKVEITGEGEKAKAVRNNKLNNLFFL